MYWLMKWGTAQTDYIFKEKSNQKPGPPVPKFPKYAVQQQNLSNGVAISMDSYSWLESEKLQNLQPSWRSVDTDFVTSLVGL